MSRSREARLTIVNVGYQSTNYWVIGAGTSRLIVDLGFPGTMGTLRARLDRMGIPLAELRLALATHYHIDHAGAAQDLKNAGVPLLVLESQVSAIAPMKAFTKPHDHYTEIVAAGNIVVSFSESRGVLAGLGIDGEILATPGHSDDSVTLLLDDGSAFTGDLTPPGFATEEDAELVAASWRVLRDRGAKMLYPGHGPSRPFPVIT